MPQTKASFEIRLGSLPLRVLYGQNDNLLWQEETIIGSDILNPAEGERFTDVFNTWHQGGFIAEHVQEGFYNEAINVDCTKPGEIAPGPRRITTIDIGHNGAAAGAEAIENYNVCSLKFVPELSGYLFAVVLKENAAADGVANRPTVRWIDSAYTLPGAPATQGVALDTAAADWAAGTGFSGHPRPIVRVRAGVAAVYTPVGRTGYRAATTGALGALVAAPAHALLVVGSRGFRALLSITTGEVQISNIDKTADWDVAGNWTTPVGLEVMERQLANTQVSLGLGALGEVPVVGTHRGLFALGPGGIPYDMTPQYRNLREGLGAFWPLETFGGGVVAHLPGRTGLGLFNRDRAFPIGPGVNPLVQLENFQVMDVHVAPDSSLWVYVWFPERAQATGVWEVWCGKRVGDSFSWHPVFRDVNASEGGPINFTPAGVAEAPLRQFRRPFEPVWWRDAAVPNRQPELALATGGGPTGWDGTANAAVTTDNTSLTDTRVTWVANQWVGFIVSCNGKNMTVTSSGVQSMTGTGWSGGGNPGNGNAYQVKSTRARLTFVNGGLFFDRTTYEHENGSGGYTVAVQWRSGRFSRHDARSARHWLGARFRGKNIGAAGVLGGRIRVEVSYDGGAFADPPAGATYLTSTSQYVPLNSNGRDVELRLTWQLDGVSAAVMRDTPATVTQIALEGREVPAIVRRITLVVDANNTAQAGGVRLKRTAASIMDALEALIDDGNLTVVDIHKESRTVVALPAHQLSHQDCRAFGVPQGSIQLTLLEVPSA